MCGTRERQCCPPLEDEICLVDVDNELGRFARRVVEGADQRVEQHADQVVDVVVLARFEEAGLVE